jgi:hypothetical protein
MYYDKLTRRGWRRVLRAQYRGEGGIWRQSAVWRESGVGRGVVPGSRVGEQ